FCMAPGIFYAIEALLCILAMFSLLLAYFVRKHGVPPRNPFTLQDLNDIIEISPKLASLLHVTGHNSLKDLGMKLAQTSYGLAGTRDRLKESFAIDTYPDQTVRVPPANEVPLRWRADSKSWIPFAMRPVGCVLLCLLPVALSTTLIALLIRSDKSKGIVNLPDTILAHYGWTLLPTSIFLAVVAFHGTLNTAIQILQRFHNLQEGRTERDSNTFTKDFGGMIPIRAFVHALRNGHVAMMATTLTALSGPATLVYDAVNTKIIGWFNVTDHRLPTFPERPYWPARNNSDPFMITRIIYPNASYPQWTYSELALAEIALDDDVAQEVSSWDNTVSSHPPSITVETPALRAVMNCTSQPYASARQLPPAPYQGTDPAPHYTLDYALLEVNLTLPDICSHIDEDSSLFPCFNSAMSTQWVYKRGIIGYWAGSWAQVGMTMGIFGDIDAIGNPRDLTILTCMPYVETLQARAVFELPSFELAHRTVAEGTLETSPVEAIESTRKFFNHDSFWTLFGENLTGDPFDKVLPSVNRTGFPSQFASSDGFFQALFQGKDAIADPKSLLGPENSEKLIAAVEHLYRIIMAQSLHTAQGRRIPVSSEHDPLQPTRPPLGTGTITNPNGKRMYQSHIATYILIALLVMMLIYAIVELTTFRPKGLVTMEPTCLAARMSLLIDYHAAAGHAMVAQEGRVIPMRTEPTTPLTFDNGPPYSQLGRKPVPSPTSSGSG
ncbi:MAG: hypothetical protein L6R42_006215, partial [Xanthoria sp. 1 TBL-2021]